MRSNSRTNRELLFLRLFLRLFRQYSISWYEIPVALLLSTYGHLLEIPGMLVAVRGEPLQTAYR